MITSLPETVPVVDPAFALVALLGLLLTVLALNGNIARVERGLLLMEADALLILVVYLGEVYSLLLHGIG
jgi:hypothetical protein